MPGALLVDFGLRRAHAGEAGLLAARAGYLAGLDGSATVLAGQLFDIPIFGTMAHAFIEAHDDEALAFEHFARSQPVNVVLLIGSPQSSALSPQSSVLSPQSSVLSRPPYRQTQRNPDSASHPWCCSAGAAGGCP